MPEAPISTVSEAPKKDRIIQAIIDKTPGPLKPKLQVLFGPNQMRADRLEPIFQKQVERGRLTPAQAAGYRESIIDGSLDAKYIFIDGVVAFVISATLNKPATGFTVDKLIESGYPGLAALAGFYGVTTNPFASPYFAARAVQEYRNSKKQLTQEGKLGWKQRKELGKRAAVLAGVTALNFIPIGNYFPTFLMSKYRTRGLAKTIGLYHWDNLKDSRLGKAVTKVADVGKAAGRMLATSLPPPDL